MSAGVCICSACSREVHARYHPDPSTGRRLFWIHCEDQSLICPGAIAAYAREKAEIKGKFCLADDSLKGTVAE